ncbi:hypothetical protein SD70_26060 [Gordoniibacillus kamchatkensis]|uniref:Uncharacterized protein n=2 Tax=Gordoniibacillus kamchatkensis TaxID=1590651 RepID=A0ABR5ABU4_9BACL|nr:hypothetical protein SD70_26060 [Paenibacillus sp. VKM B-2647]
MYHSRKFKTYRLFYGDDEYPSYFALFLIELVNDIELNDEFGNEYTNEQLFTYIMNGLHIKFKEERRIQSGDGSIEIIPAGRHFNFDEWAKPEVYTVRSKPENVPKKLIQKLEKIQEEMHEEKENDFITSVIGFLVQNPVESILAKKPKLLQLWYDLFYRNIPIFISAKGKQSKADLSFRGMENETGIPKSTLESRFNKLREVLKTEYNNFYLKKAS